MYGEWVKISVFYWAAIDFLENDSSVLHDKTGKFFFSRSSLHYLISIEELVENSFCSIVLPNFSRMIFAFTIQEESVYYTYMEESL